MKVIFSSITGFIVGMQNINQAVLMCRIIVKISTLIRASDDEGHHVSVFPDLLVADGRFQQVSMLIDPGLKIERG